MTLNIGIIDEQTYINIQPMLAQFDDEQKSTQLFITSIQDNNYDTAIIYYELRSAPVEQIADPETNIVITHGKDSVTYARRQYKMQGAVYNNWCNSIDSTYPFEALLAAYSQFIAV